MSRKVFSESSIVKILKEAEGGILVPDLCRIHGMSRATFYKWRSRYGGMDASMISENKSLLEENKRLKRMYADLSLQHEAVKEALSKKW